MAHAKSGPIAVAYVCFFWPASVAAAWTNSSPWSIWLKFDQSKPKIITCLSGFGGVGGEDVLRLPLSSSLIAIIKPTQLNTEGIWIGSGGRKQKAGCKKEEKNTCGHQKYYT